MIGLIYRAYRGLPGQRRLAIVSRINSILSSSRVLNFIWRKTILRYHMLYGHRRGITIELTDKCNLKCAYCPKSLDIGIKGSHIQWDIFVKAFEGGLSEGPLDTANLVGFGEPFLYPHLERAVRFIKERSPSTRVSLTSNGTLLSKRWGEVLADAGLDQISISVNATSREQYKRINNADEYDKVVRRTIEFLQAVQLSGKSMHVIVQVLDGVNDDAQIESFKTFWEPHLGNVGTIQIQPFVNWAGQIDTAAILSREEEERRKSVPEPATTQAISNHVLIRQQKERKKDVESPFEHDNFNEEPTPYPCYHLHKTRIVSREGNALACCMVFPDEQGDLALGSLRTSSYDQLYSGQKIKELRALDLSGRLGAVKPCNSCNAWKTVPNIWWRNPLHGVIGPKWF